jgi:type IV pilus assembly protein PilV
MKMQRQSGMFLLEALIAILIFSLGVLGMVAMGSTAIAAQSDAQFRTEAANFANEIASKIALNVNPLDIPGSIQTFAHQPVSGGYCSFAGAASTNTIVTDWVSEVTGGVAGTLGLPGATATSQSIVINTAAPGYNVVTVTVCWKPPNTSATPLAPWHREVAVTYVANQL